MGAAVGVVRRGAGFGYVVRTGPTGTRGNLEVAGVQCCLEKNAGPAVLLTSVPVYVYVFMRLLSVIPASLSVLSGSMPLRSS